VAKVLVESFGELASRLLARVTRPVLHFDQVLVDAVLRLEPIALAGVAGFR
jgi:hypothetical protein